METMKEAVEAKCPKCDMPVSEEAHYCDHCGSLLLARRKVPAWHLHRRMYDWVLSFANRRHAMTALFVLSFAESSFFPIPPDALLMPLALGNRKKWWRYAAVCSVASVLGAVAGFLIGWLAWEGVGNFFHDHVPGFGRDVVVLVDGREVQGFADQQSLQVRDGYSVEPSWPFKLSGLETPLQQPDVRTVTLHSFTKVGKLYEVWNFLVVFTAGFTPIPYKVITITAGIFGTGPAVGNKPLFFAVFVLASVLSRSARFFLVAGLMRMFGPRIMPFIDRYLGALTLAFVVLLIAGFYVFKFVF